MVDHLERFLRKVIRVDSGCWLWIGATRPNGYGNVNINGRTTGAHRASWALHHGSIPDGMQVLHRCDVRNCVNPAHLFLGSQRDNMQDMITKGRAGHYEKSGDANPMHGRRHSDQTKARIAAIRSERYTREQHPRATITQDIAAEIKRLRSDGMTCKAIAESLRVSFHVVRNVAGGKSWLT